MIELNKDKRLFLPKNVQKNLFEKIFEKVPIKKASIVCKISERTLRDWKRGKFTPSLKSTKKLCQIAGLSLPTQSILVQRYWYTGKAGKKGGKATFKKHKIIGGDPEKRKEKWLSWWEKEGKFTRKDFIAPKKIKKPHKSKKLAEFTGIIIGDGGISKKQVVITLHSEDDKDYGKFIIKLAKQLFNVPVGKYYSKKFYFCSYVISRVELVRFCKNLGLKQGNKIKQNIDIPKWIKKSKDHLRTCLRGLMDTDGSIVIHRYKSKNRLYSYKKIEFTSMSPALISSVYNSLSILGIKSRVTRNKEIKIENKKEVNKYFKIIGSNNPKHLKRYRS